ncbi:hypothetical protein QR680_003426 [Steinernema hermaphroditum]|uniref:Uncharacterized protein n=1 Tax=Steinernema hermaphroditum TaxID=289476 RepID=A0AA39H7M2_9BILA|nr:hypothetical protein QR680_003426 [Steinernema hermaphroditum]
MVKQAQSSFPYIAAIPDLSTEEEDEDDYTPPKALQATRGTLIKIRAYAPEFRDACHMDGYAVARVRIFKINNKSDEYLHYNINLSFIKEVMIEILPEPIPSNYFRNIMPKYLAMHATNHPEDVELWLRGLSKADPLSYKSCDLLVAQRELRKMLFNYYPTEKAMFVDSYVMLMIYVF